MPIPNLFLLFATIFCLQASLAVSQTPKIDSLKGLLESMPEDSNKLKILMEINEDLYRIEPELGLDYANRSKNLAVKLDRKEDLAYSLKFIGLCHYFKSNFTEVFTYWDSSLLVFKSIDHQLGISNQLSNLGAVYYSLGDDAKALEYYIESLKYAEELGDKTRETTALINIGAVYSNNEATYTQALETLLKALVLSQELGEKDAIGTTSLNIGEIYMKQNDLDRAITFFEKSLEAFDDIGGNIPTALNYLGKAYFQKDDHPKALQFFGDAYEHAVSQEAKIEMAQSLLNIADVHLAQGKYYDALVEGTQAKDIANQIGAQTELKLSYNTLSKANAGLGNFNEAYNYSVKHINLKDTLRAELFDERISNLMIQHDTESKRKQIELLNKDNEIQAERLKRNMILRNFMFVIGGLLLIIIGGIYSQYRYIRKSRNIIAEERNRSDEILLNILPKDTADELKEKGYVEARKFEETSVLFTDFKEFTRHAENISPEELVQSLDFYFKKFDEIVGKHNLEKIKTIGDAYMCVGGLPIENTTNPGDATRAALEMMEFVKAQLENPTPGIYPFEIRIGINTGSVVAGVVGTKKFQYDIWGNTVNIASRMESNSVPGKINISENIYNLIKDEFDCTYRGEFEVKNAGTLKMYFVEGEKTA